MAVPISLMSRIVLLACAAILPFTAFFAAYAYDGEKRRMKLNILSFTVGVVTIGVVGVVLYLNS